MTRREAGDQAFDHSGLYGTEREMPYSGVRSFLRRRYCRDLSGVDFAVLGVPFDLATSGRSGARMGPQALRAASSQVGWGDAVFPWGLDPFETLAVVDYGDVAYHRGRTEEMLANAEAMAGRIVDAGAGVIGLGGDHLVSYPLLKAHAAKHGPLALVHFDAHRDTADSPYLDHGTFVHHAMQDGLIDPARSVQIGIRTHYDHTDPITVLYRPWVRQHGAAAVVAEIARITAGGPAYLTFDIDCMDPAFAPGTGTPVSDGLTPGEVFDILRGLRDTPVRFVGMDLVEVAPAYDTAEVTALLGATLVQEFLCLCASQRTCDSV